MSKFRKTVGRMMNTTKMTMDKFIGDKDWQYPNLTELAGVLSIFILNDWPTHPPFPGTYINPGKIEDFYQLAGHKDLNKGLFEFISPREIEIICFGVQVFYHINYREETENV